MNPKVESPHLTLHNNKQLCSIKFAMPSFDMTLPPPTISVRERNVHYLELDISFDTNNTAPMIEGICDEQTL